MAVDIRHKSALSVLALALTLYAGAKFCYPPAPPLSPPSARDALYPDSAPGGGAAASAACPLAITAFECTPSNATLGVALSESTIPSNSVIRVMERRESFTNEWDLAAEDFVPNDVTNLILVLSSPATNAAFYTVTVSPYAPPVSFPGLPYHENDDGTRLYVATNPADIAVSVDRSDRPATLPVSDEERRANPFYDDARFAWDCDTSTVSLPGVGEYPIRGGDRLLVVDPSVAYGTAHAYSGSSVVLDAEGNPCAFKNAYPLDSLCLWEAWHEGTNAVGASVCSCRPSMTVEPDLSAYGCFSNTLAASGETAEGRLFLDGREIWSGTAVHSGGSSGGPGRSDVLSDDGCGSCGGCEDGDCDALEGPSLGSVRFRIPLGSPRAGQVSGFLWFESDAPFTPDTRSFRLLARSDADIEELELFGFRHVYCHDARGRTVTLSNLVDGVSATVRDTVSGAVEHVWEVTRVADGMRFVKRSRLGNVMEDRSYTRSGAAWTETDDVSGVSVVETRSEDWRDGVFTLGRVVTSAGVVAEHTVVVSSLVGTDSGPVVREMERRTRRADGSWTETVAGYHGDATRLGTGLLRYEGGDDRDWSWHDYDLDGREIFTLEQRDGSVLPDPCADYSLAVLPACDAFATVLDYTPLAGDGDDVNDRDRVRTLSRYAVADGSATLIGRTWTRVERGVFAAEYPRADTYPLVRTTTVRAASQTAALDNPANAVSVSVAYSSDSPLVPYALRGRTVAFTDEDGVTELTSYATVSNALRAVTRRLKGSVEAKTRRVTEEDPVYGHVLYEATQLTAAPSVEFAWRRMAYDEKGRLRSVRYDDGSSETNAYSCCRLLWSVDRTGAKTLRSATTGTDRLYWAEEEVSLAELPFTDYGTPRGYIPYEGYRRTSDASTHRTTMHYLDGLGRETNRVVTLVRDVGGAELPGCVYPAAGGWRTEERTDYTNGFSDVSRTVDARGALRICTSRADGEEEVTEEALYSDASATNLLRRTVTTNRRGGAAETVVSDAEGEVRRTRSFEDYGADGCVWRVTVESGRDAGAVTNSAQLADFLGRTVRMLAPGSDVRSSFDGASSRECSVTDVISGVTVTNVYDALGENIGYVRAGTCSIRETRYESRSNAWWRVESSAEVGSVTNGTHETWTRLTGLSDALRSEEVGYENGVFAESVTSAVGDDPRQIVETTESALSGRIVRTMMFGRTISESSPSGDVSYRFDPYGRVFYSERSRSPGGMMYRDRYYDRNSVGDIVEDDEFFTVNPAEAYATRYAYDTLGNRVRTDRPDDTSVSTAYDGEGRRIRECGDAYPVSFGYDGLGRMLTLATTRDGVTPDVTSWTYDTAGKRTSRTFADGSSETYAYTPDALPLRTTRADGSWTENRYNADRRLVGVDSSDPRCAYAATPDEFGRVTAASSMFGSVAAAYGVGVTATNETTAVGADVFSLVRSVDAFGRLTGFSGSDYEGFAVVYSPEGRIASLSNGTALVTCRYTGDLLPAGVEIAFADGRRFARTLRRSVYLRDEVTSVTNASPTVTNVISYAYDAMHRPVSRGGDTFAYNRRGEVASATIAGQSESHAYDFIGNSVTSSVSSAASGAVTELNTANDLNQYTSITRSIEQSNNPNSLAYTANGDLVSAGDFVYSYDALSRLTAACSAQTGLTISNEYDHLSRRIRKVAPDGNHVYFYDGWNLVLELIRRPDNTTDRIEYYWGPDLSGSLQGAGGIGGLLYLKYNGAIYIPFYDAYGNILGYWNAMGGVVASYTYDAFGKTIATSGPLADVFSFRYSTKYFDSETELYYYGYRYYSPELRRWFTRDPIEETGGVNLYAFCGNDGVEKHDSLGCKTLGEDVEAHALLQAVCAACYVANRPMTGKFLGIYLDENNSGSYKLADDEVMKIITQDSFRTQLGSEARMIIIRSGAGRISHKDAVMREHRFYKSIDGDLWSAFNDIKFKISLDGCIKEIGTGRLRFHGNMTVDIRDTWSFSDKNNAGRMPFQFWNFLPDRYQYITEQRFLDLESRGWAKPFRISGQRKAVYTITVNRSSKLGSEVRYDPYNS